MTLASSQTLTSGQSSGLDSARATLDRPEQFLVLMIVAIGVTSVVLSLLKDQAVAWNAFGLSFLPAFGLLLVGLYLRGPKAAPRLSHWAIANSIYLGFSGVIAILIYLRFPIETPLIGNPPRK